MRILKYFSAVVFVYFSEYILSLFFFFFCQTIFFRTRDRNASRYNTFKVKWVRNVEPVLVFNQLLLQKTNRKKTIKPNEYYNDMTCATVRGEKRTICKVIVKDSNLWRKWYFSSLRVCTKAVHSCYMKPYNHHSL